MRLSRSIRRWKVRRGRTAAIREARDRLDPESFAIVAYLDFGRPPFGGDSNARVEALKSALGRRDVDCEVAQVQVLMHEAEEVSPGTGPDYLAQATRQVEDLLVARHPDLATEAVRAVVSYYAWCHR
jgi:hypothetical protein